MEKTELVIFTWDHNTVIGSAVQNANKKAEELKGYIDQFQIVEMGKNSYGDKYGKLIMLIKTIEAE